MKSEQMTLSRGEKGPRLQARHTSISDSVARIERSEIRDRPANAAGRSRVSLALNPGYSSPLPDPPRKRGREPAT
jgi:hypothetical protein